jgi:two-component system, LytTR family, sensor kinase
MKKPVVILLHCGYWLLYLLLIISFLFIMTQGKHPLSPFAIGQMMFFSPLLIMAILPGVVAFYSYYHLLFNRFLLHKRFAPFAGYGLLIAGCCGAIPILLLLLPGSWHAHLSPDEGVFMGLFVALLAMIHGIIGLVMKGFISWYADIKLKKDLLQRNYETELALVKSQINPHFLFNTINNIDVLIEKDAAKASLYLNKLSDIMRFMLYETKPDLIPLSKELAYIDKYIELQRIRSSNAHYVTCEIAGEPGNRMISPMLFISYIENAFKHSEHRKSEPAIHIRINIHADSIVFDCENKYSRDLPDTSGHNGLGNELLRKRLSLLYPNRHTLQTGHERGVYKVTLNLQTNGY